MRLKKLLPYLIAFALIIAGYFLTSIVFPKNLNRYPGLVLIILLELYLWSFIKKKIFIYHLWVRISLILLYWLPLFALGFSTFVAVYIPTTAWNVTFTIYLFGFIFVFYLAKLIPGLILLSYKLVSSFRRLVELLFGKRKTEHVTSAARMSRARFIENMAYVSGGIVLGSLITGMFKWVHDFRIFRHNIPISTLPSVFDGFKIIQISDLHLGSWPTLDPLQEAIDIINAEEADLVVFTGDLVNYATDEAFRFSEVLSGIRAKHGVLAILGNHDYGDYTNWPTVGDKKKNMEDLYRFYDEIGWNLLRNEHIIIENEGEKIGIIGVENWGSNPRFPQLGNIVSAEKGIEKVSAKILLSHDPSHWKSVVLKQHHDIDLMMAGHTHGFQFGIEIPGIKWSPAQYIYNEWAGLYTDPLTNQKLYVNRGIGSIGYPGRIGILPEITVLTLKSTI
ncbi:MAG: metallophosphoesterase [Bacteroidales bacterium]|nr:metallophosphoesterase [Bacteroidales bacterium]